MDASEIEVYNNLDDVVVEQQPQAVTLHHADVVSSIRATAAVDDKCEQIIKALRVDRVVRLEEKIQQFKKN